MNISETLKFFRKKRKLSQSKAKPKDLSQPAYSAIERDDRSITMNELQEYLENTSITPNEFFSFSDFNNNQARFRELFLENAANFESQSKAELSTEILEHYHSFKKLGGKIKGI